MGKPGFMSNYGLNDKAKFRNKTSQCESPITFIFYVIKNHS